MNIIHPIVLSVWVKQALKGIIFVFLRQYNESDNKQ